MPQLLMDFTAERLNLIYSAFFWGCFLTFIAWKAGFYSLPHPASKQRGLLFRDVLGAFSFFLLIQVVVAPLLAHGWLKYVHEDAAHLTSLQQGWLNAASAVGSALMIFFFCRIIEPRAGRIVIGEAKGGWASLRNLFFGAMTWLIANPFIIVVNQALTLLMDYFHPSPEVDQVAVKYLKQAIQDPDLFWVTVIMVVGIAPCIEETLFRGFLQTWLRQRLGTASAIILTSLVFTSFHFSSSQGWTNVELLASLFFLSLYLGFIYIRQQSLWASIGLHMTFNGISVIFIVLSEGANG